MTPETMGKIVFAISQDPALQDNHQVVALKRALTDLKDSTKLRLVSDNTDKMPQSDFDWCASSKFWTGCYEREKAGHNHHIQCWNSEVDKHRITKEKLRKKAVRVSELQYKIERLNDQIAKLTADNAAVAGLKTLIGQMVAEAVKEA